MEFTDAQKEAILASGQALQILACAGSGKTEVLARRVVKHLLDGIPPESIVAFTFTEKAAGELKDRIESRAAEANKHFQSLPPCSAGLFVGTIHSYCLHLLQRLGGKYEIFDPLSEEREWALLQRFARRLGVVDLMNQTWPGRPISVKRAVEVFQRNLSVAYNERLKHDVLQKRASDFAQVFERYAELLSRMQLLSFDQMIDLACNELAPGGRLRKALDGKVSAVFVDEYQDLNRAQEELLRHLTDMGASLTVVGDDDQAIYQWRGGEVSLFLDFGIRYPDAVSKTLSENHRSVPAIVKVASGFASSITQRKAKSMLPVRPEPCTAVELLVADTPEEEAECIMHRVHSLVRAGHKLSDMAVLYRSVRTSASPLVQILRKEKIPFALVGRLSILDRPEIALLARVFIWWAGGKWMPNEEEEVVTPERLASDIVDLTGVSEAQAAQILSQLERMGTDLLENGVYNIAQTYMDMLRLLGLPVLGPEQKRQEQQLGQFSHLLAEFEHAQRRAAPQEFRHSKIPSAAEEEAEDGAIELTGPAAEKAAEIRPAIASGQVFLWRLRVFLEEFGSQAAEEMPNRPALDADALNIMTVHQSKGLEFPIIFLPALVDRRFPSARMGEKQLWYLPEDLFDVTRYQGKEDDERRLFYVAMTRARELLVLSCFTQYAGSKAKVSRFLKDLIKGPHSDCLMKMGECNPAICGKTNGSCEVLSADFGQLLTFSECSYKYYLRYVCGFEPPIAPELGFGKLLHHVIAELARSSRGGRPPTSVDIDAILDHSFYLPFAGPIAYDKLFKAAKRRLTNYVRNYGRDLVRTIEPERAFEIPLDYARIRGRIDLVLRAEGGGSEEVELVDFKTAVKRPPSRTHQNQLRMYGEAARALGMKPVKLVIHDLDSDQGGAIVVEENEAEVASFRTELHQWLQDIREREFSPRSGSTQCPSCDFARLCEPIAPRKRK